MEGIAAVRVARSLGQQHSVELPIVEQLYQVSENCKAARETVETLLSRDIKPEI